MTKEAFVQKGLIQIPSSVLPFPVVRKPFQGLTAFPLGGFKALSFSGGWKNSCVPSTIQAVCLDSLFTHPPSSLRAAGSAGLLLSGESGFEVG